MSTAKDLINSFFEAFKEKSPQHIIFQYPELQEEVKHGVCKLKSKYRSEDTLSSTDIEKIEKTLNILINVIDKTHALTASPSEEGE